MTKRKRLSIYKKALADYQEEMDVSKDGCGIDCKYTSGICWYMEKSYGYEIMYQLPELDAEIDRALNRNKRGCWICEMGELKPRIALLKRVIKKMES